MYRGWEGAGMHPLDTCVFTGAPGRRFQQGLGQAHPSSAWPADSWSNPRG